MEITSFVLGMLAIVTVAMVAVIVVGIVKILKLTNQVSDLKLRLDREVECLYREMNSRQESIWRQFESAGRDVTMVEKTIMNHIDAKQRELEQAHVDLHRMVEHESEHGRRYTDSRIDKLIDTYFDLVGDKIKEKKAIING